MTSAALPLEIWGEILSWLYLQDLQACDIACKEWHLAELLYKSIRTVTFEDAYSLSDDKLVKMINLEKFELHPISSPLCLNKFIMLRELRITHKATLTKDLRGLTKLLSLNISKQCSLPEGLWLPVSLRRLSISFCSNANQLDGLTSLTNLTFTSAERVDQECLHKVPQLRSFSLYGGAFLISNEAIFRTLSSLTRLELWCASSITDKCLVPLVHLQSLLLSENRFVTSKGLNALPRLARLALASVDFMIDRSKLKASIKVYEVNKNLRSLGSWLDKRDE